MKNWYCLQVSANRMKSFIESFERIKDASGEGDAFGTVFSPAEEVVEIKRGKRKVSERKFFPNYVFIEMEMNERTFNLVKQLPMTRGFVGGIRSQTPGSEWRPPDPIPEFEIQRLQTREKEGMEKPKPKVMFEIGKSVRIKEGPFTNFTGNVVDVNYESNRISVTVNVFNRPTEIQTDFENVEKT